MKENLTSPRGPSFESLVLQTLKDWERTVVPIRKVINDEYSTPTYSSLEVCQVVIAPVMQDLKIPFVFNPGLVSYAFKREHTDSVHVSFVSVRTTPIDLPLAIPSASECAILKDFISFAFSRLRFCGASLSTIINEYDIHHKDVFISVGYMQISGSLTSKRIGATDKVQGCVLDYICDNTLGKDFIVEELKETQEIYREIARRATMRGQID